MAEQQVTNLGTRAAPLTRITKDSEEFTLLNVKASFDGSAASTAFVPAVRILSDSGQEVGTYPADDQVAAGGSADATFAPFLRNKRGEIRYNRENDGGYLHVMTEATAGFGGIVFQAEAGEIRFFVDDSLAGAFRVDGPFIRFDTSGVSLRLLDSGETFFECDAGASWRFSEMALDATDGEVFLVSHQSGGTYPQAFVDADAQSSTLYLGADDSASKTTNLQLDASVPAIRGNVADGVGGGDYVFTAGHDFDVEVGRACNFQLPVGGTFNVTNHNGAVILRVDEAGTYHIKTGAAWVADLP